MGGNAEAYGLWKETGFTNGSDYARFVASGLSREEFNRRERERISNDKNYQNTLVGYAESNVYKLELELSRVQKELEEARKELATRKTEFENKFGEYKRSPDTVKSLHLAHNRATGNDIHVWEEIITANKESLEDIYGPG